MGIQDRSGVRFILDWLEVIDSMDIDSVGEFRFLFRIRSDRRGILRDTAFPEEGTISISEDAGRNHMGPLQTVLFEGDIEPDEKLTLEVTGEEVDRLSRNDPLDSYERTFEGDPSTWVGLYAPWDEGETDPENLAQWLIGYRIEAMAAGESDPVPATTPSSANPR